MRTRIALGVAPVLASVFFSGVASGQALVGDPFVNNLYAGWVDAFPPPVRAGNWRLSLHNPTLMDTNNANPPTAGATNNDGTYQPDVLVQNNFAAPGTYDLAATMRTSDDDIIGLVWNYQDPDNYFRVGIRQQAAGTFGGTQGLAVQKIVGGVLTQISPAGVGVGAPSPITQAAIDNRTPFELKVVVDGTNWQVLFDNTPVVNGTDPDLVAGRKVGVQSWAQQSDVAAVTPFWGTEVESLRVTQGANTLYDQSFAARPVRWRQVVMPNAAGVTTMTTASRDDVGNYGLDVNRPWVLQHSNGFENATTGAANVDFIGPAVVVDEPGSTSLSDYEMRVRLGAADNDGIGVLVRVQDDDSFYRVNFSSEAMGTAGTRAPQGMSVQKVKDGVWSELFRDDQVAPLFVYTPGTAGQTPDSGLPVFDLLVRAEGNALSIRVIEDPEGVARIIDYPVITDLNDPLLSGTVGLFNWGTENAYYMNYGGDPGPLVTVVPEPGALLVFGAVGALIRRRRVA
jgi:hypothetical protein